MGSRSGHSGVTAGPHARVSPEGSRYWIWSLISLPTPQRHDFKTGLATESKGTLIESDGEINHRLRDKESEKVRQTKYENKENTEKYIKKKENN